MVCGTCNNIKNKTRTTENNYSSKKRSLKNEETKRLNLDNKIYLEMTTALRMDG